MLFSLFLDALLQVPWDDWVLVLFLRWNGCLPQLSLLLGWIGFFRPGFFWAWAQAVVLLQLGFVLGLIPPPFYLGWAADFFVGL